MMDGTDAGRTDRSVVKQAMSRMRRADFLPASQRWLAADDAPIELGHGQTNSQPSTVEAMLVLLDVRAGQRVLDMGSGSGWTTAILGDLVGPRGSVVGVERIRELAERSRGALEGQALERVHIRDAVPGVLGDPEQAPFDRILVSAEAVELPEELIAQLCVGGVMVIPVDGSMLRVERRGEGPEDYAVTEHGGYRFVPLVRDDTR